MESYNFLIPQLSTPLLFCTPTIRKIINSSQIINQSFIKIHHAFFFYQCHASIVTTKNFFPKILEKELENKYFLEF